MEGFDRELLKVSIVRIAVATAGRAKTEIEVQQWRLHHSCVATTNRQTD